MGSKRAEALAERFEAANHAVRAAIAGATDEALHARCTGEDCTVAALACHVASVHVVVSEWIRTLVADHVLPSITMDDVDRANAEGFARDAGCSREEVLDRLACNGEAAADMIRGLTDIELDRVASFALYGGTNVSTQTVIERILIGDPLAHLPSIQVALAGAAKAEP